MSSPMDRAGIVGEKSTGYPKALGAIGRNKGPHVRIRADVEHDASVAREVGRGCGFSVSIDVTCRSHDNARKNSAPAHHQGRIGDLAYAQGKVEPVFDHVAEAIAHHELDLQPRVIGEQGGQALSEEATGCSGDTHAHQPHRRGALSSKGSFDSIDAVQYWPR